ncbi:YHYH domain-containing protein [Cupriavidus campinensis]
MKTLRLTAVAVALLTAWGLAGAHSGGTDAQGCHVDHKTGIRHCH